MPLLAGQLREMESKGKKVLVVFPDEGASKRFKSDLASWPSITCVKVRDGAKRVVTLKHGECVSASATVLERVRGCRRPQRLACCDSR